MERKKTYLRGSSVVSEVWSILAFRVYMYTSLYNKLSIGPPLADTISYNLKLNSAIILVFFHVKGRHRACSLVKEEASGLLVREGVDIGST